MRVLVVNAGSSSLKLSLLDDEDALLFERDVADWDGHDTSPIEELLSGIGQGDAVGHRVVHGGEGLTGPVVVDDAMEREIEELTSLAPLHQPRSLAGIRTLRGMDLTIPTVACFDTAFHTTLPVEASTYAIPGEWRNRWPLRRFGFHGLSHGYIARRTPAILGRSAEGLRIVSCHLGSGASLAAIVDGRSVDTTMGFTPLDGLVMATRSGSVDPGLVLWLMTEGGMSADQVTSDLRERSGLAGLTGGTGDMREVLEARERQDEEAVVAFDVYMHRLAGMVASMTAAMGGLDVLVFTGGVGENSPTVRAEAANRLSYLGVAIDDQRNQDTRGADAVIGGNTGPVTTLVIHSREDLEIARQTRELLSR